MTTEIVALPVEPVADPAPERMRRLRRGLRNAALAVLGLVYVLGVALLTMAAGGAVLHALRPTRQFDIFYALHQPLVWGCLFGLSLLWLLPPYPWTAETEEAATEGPATSAGGTEGDGVSNVTALAEYRGRDPSRRPSAQQGGAG